MKIGVISDTHDRLDKMEQAMERFQAAGAGAIIHCGDFVAPFAVPVLFKPGIKVFSVFGNNDGERIGLRNRIYKDEMGILMPGPIQVELEGRKLIVNHEPMPEALFSASEVDAFIYGHTHEAVVKKGPPLALNPGECCGWLYGRSTAAILDLETMEAEILVL